MIIAGHHFHSEAAIYFFKALYIPQGMIKKSDPHSDVEVILFHTAAKDMYGISAGKLFIQT